MFNSWQLGGEGIEPDLRIYLGRLTSAFTARSAGVSSLGFRLQPSFSLGFLHTGPSKD